MSGEGRDPPGPSRLSVPDPWIDVEEARRQRGALVWSWFLERLNALRRRAPAAATAPIPEQER